MTVILSRKQVERFTPAHYGADATEPVYIVAPLNYRERATFRADLVRAGAATYPSDGAIVAAVRAGLVEMAPDNLDELLAHLDAFADMLGETPAAKPEGTEAEPASPEALAEHEADRARRMAIIEAYRPVEDAMRSFPRVAALLAARATYAGIAPTLAAAHALRGWSDDIPLAFRRVGGVVPDELIEQLPRQDLEEIGSKALEMLQPSETERKN